MKNFLRILPITLVALILSALPLNHNIIHFVFLFDWFALVQALIILSFPNSTLRALFNLAQLICIMTAIMLSTSVLVRFGFEVEAFMAFLLIGLNLAFLVFAIRRLY